MTSGKERHSIYMKKALAYAKAAFNNEEVPIGAILVKEGKIVSGAHNLTRTKKDPTAHAEILAIQEASIVVDNERLSDLNLYVTIEPCAMCAGAIIQARIPLVVYGARDPKAGACGSVLRVIPNKDLNHRPKVVGGILDNQCATILKNFFRKKREINFSLKEKNGGELVSTVVS